MIASEIRLTKKRPRSSGGQLSSNGSSIGNAPQEDSTAPPLAASKQIQAAPQFAPSGLPLNRETVKAAIAAIPQDRNEELLRNIVEAGQDADPEKIRSLLVRWVMIGSHYGDPDREKNHRLAKVIGSFKDPEWLDELGARIDQQRALDRQ